MGVAQAGGEGVSEGVSCAPGSNFVLWLRVNFRSQ